MPPTGETPVLRDAGRTGFTLMELAVSVAVISIIMVAVGSTIILAGKAIPDADNPASRTLTAARAVDQIAAELYSVVSVNQKSATMIEFVVDRGGANKTIRYEWSGAPGEPLTRRYDGGTVINVLEAVQDFALTYHTTGSGLLESVGIELLVGPAPAIRARTEALTLNRPEVSAE